VEGNGPSQYKAFYSEVNARMYLRENKCPLGCSDRDLEAAAVRDKALYKKFGFEREEQPAVPTPTWYGVAKGKRPGVYSKWTDAKAQVPINGDILVGKVIWGVPNAQKEGN
jgi:viroplasmin and RNaseH domain-containing protein